MMPTDQDLISFWDNDQLKRWPKKLLLERGFPQEDCEYLSRIGLPREDDWAWEINERVTDLPRAEGAKNLIIIAYDTAVVPICADVSHDARIVAVEDPQTSRFVNSSVRHFGACLYHFRRLAFYERGEDSESDHEVCRSLFRAIIEIDEPAVSHEETYWALILAQIKAGRI
jgi:hypothetical protein